MSPILVRPVREQLEHDRIIRLLQTKFRRKHEAGMNPGNEQNIAVGAGTAPVYPDLVLASPDRGRRVQAVVEVETGESVNHLEALSQWAPYSRLRAAFHLYLPSGMVDVARRLCEDNQISVNEIWSYHTVGDEVRFTLVHKGKEAAQPRAREAAPARHKAAAAAPHKTAAAAPHKTAAAAPRRAARGAKPPARKAPKKPARAQKRR